MTQMEFEWGEPIATGCKRPEWLRDGETILCLNRADDWVGPRTVLSGNKPIWAWMREFKLPADHPYYIAAAAGFTYWPGGENAPDDWDGDRSAILYRKGSTTGRSPNSWKHDAGSDDIIGYRRRTIAEPQPVSEWSLKRVREIAGASAVEYAFARYIEQHESAPVDPDVLAVREILAAYTLHFDESYVTEDIYKAGEGDGQTWFLAVLEVYRTIKANGGVVK